MLSGFKGELKMDSSTIRLICAVVAAALLFLVVARRRKRPE